MAAVVVESVREINGVQFPPVVKRCVAGDSSADEDLLFWQIGDMVTIYNRNARQLDPIPDESVHLIITSPPYNVGTNYGRHDDSLPMDEYLDLLDSVWRECRRVLVPGGRICVNVPAGVGRNPYIPLADLVRAGMERYFSLRGTIVWDKGTSGNRTSWGSYRLPTDPAIRDTTERIIVAHKGAPGIRLCIPDEVKKRDNKGVYSPFLEDGDLFRELTQDHWVISPESKSRVGHPAPFPVELPERLIRLYAYPGATILDPFGGSGSTAVAAIRLTKSYAPGCRTILVELDYDYCILSIWRCLNELYGGVPKPRQPPRC